MTDVGSQGIRGRRKSTYVAGAVVLIIVAVTLTIAANATGTAGLFWVALVLVLVAGVLIALGKRIRHTPPAHDTHPRITHDEDHPKDESP